MRGKLFKSLLLVIFILSFPAAARPEAGAGQVPGVATDEIVIGMSNALSGPASALGTGLKTGAAVYFDKVNAAGGVHGRKIRVVSYDDGYEPSRTSANTRRLIKRDKVFVLFGYVGTPTSASAVPISIRSKVPYLFPFTGAEFLRSPVNRFIFNIRASYFQETEGLVEHLVADLGLRKIGVFVQDDAYGAAGKAVVMRSLEKREIPLAGEGRYKRNTEDVEAGLAALKKAAPEAVIMVGAYKACAAFIKTARREGFTPNFLNISFVGTAALARELGDAGEGVVISQVMPLPSDPSLPIVKRYQEDMLAAGRSEFEFTSLEGYVDAVVFVEVLRKVGRDLDRAALISALESFDADVGGLRVSYGPDNHQGLKEVYFTKIQGGRAVAVTKF